VYKFTRQEEFKYHKLLNLNLPLSALYLLAAPSTLGETRDQIAQRAEAGDKISYKTVKDTIARSGSLHRAPRRVEESKPELSPTTQGAIDDAPKNRPTTALDLLELWDRAPMTERRSFINNVGLCDVLAALPENWMPAVKQWAKEERRQQPASPPMLDFAPADQGDLDIPEFLRREPGPQ
jgi:hypothetical protein